MTSDDELLSPEDMTKLLDQLITNAMPDGILDSELQAAVEKVTDMVIAAATMKLWWTNELEFGWRDGELTMRRVQP